MSLSNPPMFPIPDMNKHFGPIGLTLRDHFAYMALSMKFGPSGSTATLKEMAATCYEMADAMLEAREK